MDKYELVKKIERLAPLETQEAWDASGWIVDLPEKNVKKIFLCLTVTKQTFEQALKHGCDMIISHHPLFFVPFEYKNIQIYCAHTNFDKCDGGTTDTLVKAFGFSHSQKVGEFSRVVEEKISVKKLLQCAKKISKNARVVNNFGAETVEKIGFCAGSGSEFIDETNCDAFVTGDLKYHAAADAEKVLIDIGHFEGEYPALDVLECLLKDVEVIRANEKSPFDNI